ncbi:MAG: FAD-dependent tricarballylate dehydrogenase TcuA [Actinobacteria bacterium]|nr:FAD-dependent tricarballylate dehydrogenase TcuA [Actinomycetota bacterium]
MLVVGAGNAALSAAIAARRRGAAVLLIERASRDWRGGNSKYTRNLRCAHDPDGVMPGAYGEEEFFDDLMQVTGPETDRDLARLCIAGSREAPAWMEENGIRWQPAMRGTLHLGRTNRFFLGGGKALVNTLSATAERIGVEILYETGLVDLAIAGDRCEAVTLASGDREWAVEPRAVVLACGGFEANIGWLEEHWGAAARNYAIRGSRENDGLPLRRMLEHGAMARGNPKGFHAIAVDARGPKFEGGIVTRVDSVPFSVMVNEEAERFYDEGEDLWPKRYATWGRLIAEQPSQRAWSIFDRQVVDRFMSTVFEPFEAASIEELAVRCSLDPAQLGATVAAYNASLDGGTYDPSRLDGVATAGIAPPKSNWALPIEQPPFYAYPLCPGITFTYLGLGVDADARVRLAGEGTFQNVFAAGEIMAGNILRRGYLAGFGMTIGTVFGRIAGERSADV